MAWSVFNYNNGGQQAVAWAVALLKELGITANPANLQFVYDWEKSEGGGGAYNPLNQGPVPGRPDLTLTGPQYGGGAADFASWTAGLQGAAAYLQMPNYRNVLAAMQGSNYQAMAQALWASPWAGSHYGYGSAWSTSQYPGMSPAQIGGIMNQMGAGNVSPIGTAGAGGGVSPAAATPTAGAGAVATAPTPPPLSNMPALIAYIQKQFPDLAWMLGVPNAASVLEHIVSSGTTDPNQIQAQIQSSTWWKTTSAAIRQYEQTNATDPSAYNFAVPGSQAQQTLGTVMTEAGKLGVQLSLQQAQTVATSYLKFGWQTAELDQAIGSYVTYAASGATDAAGVVQQLKAHAGQYLLPMTPAVLQSWAQNIVGGTQNMDQFDAYLARTASTKWTGMASQIGQGMTPTQITDSLRQDAAKTMEVDPNSVDFVNNPVYAKILDFVPPAAPGQAAPAHRLMTDSEMNAYLKGTDQWQYTQQARDQASALGKTLAQTWGKLG
jgi:hypothetical protein